MNTWQELVKLCILGTQRQRVAPNWPTAALAARYRQWEALPEEQKLLNAIALAQSYRACAARPWQTGSGAAPPCENEALPYCGAGVTGMLRRFLTDNDLWLCREALALLSHHRQIVTPELLPALLSFIARQPPLIPLARPVLGQRGLWLCRQNPDWAPLLAANTDDWTLVQGAQRCRLLAAALSADASLAFAQLQQIWQQEGAKERLLLLAELKQFIDPGFKPWLAECQKDRSQAIRSLATAYLTRLGDRATVAALTGLVTAAIGVKKTLTRRLQLDITLPRAFDPNWKLFGLQEKLGHLPTGGRIGAKAGWLFQWLSALNPATLAAHYGLTLTQWLEAAAKSEFAEALLEGMDAGARLHQCGDYLFPRSENLGKDQLLRWVQSVKGDFPDAMIEPLIISLLKKLPSGKESWQQALEVTDGLAAISPEVGEILVRLLLKQQLKQQFKQQSKQTNLQRHYQTLLATLGYRLPLPLYEDFSTRLQRAQCDHFIELLNHYRQRKELHQEFARD